MKKILLILFFILFLISVFGGANLTNYVTSANIQNNFPDQIDKDLTIDGTLTATTINGTVSANSVTTSTLNATSVIQLNGTDINTGGTLTNVAYLDQAQAFSGATVTFNNNLVGTTINAVSVIQLNGTDINTGATLTNVAYLDQANVFVPTQSITNGLIVDTSTLYVDSGNNRVGIGLTAPTEVLHVSGNLLIDTSTDGIINIKDSGDTTRISFNSGGNSFVNTANFGIGTANPTEKLDISGNIKITTSNYFVIGAEDVDNSWRFRVSGNNMVFENRESGTWVNQGEFTPTP